MVALAFKEQQKLKLEWFRSIEPILKIDRSYDTDHVTVYKNNLTNSATSDSHNHGLYQENFLIHNGFVKRIPTQTMKPIKSRSFTPHIILKTLKSHYKESWQLTKTASPKLAFYNRIKDDFCKEKYLDCVDNFYDRANLTQLRISAHELQIELGRRKNIAREDPQGASSGCAYLVTVGDRRT